MWAMAEAGQWAGSGREEESGAMQEPLPSVMGTVED